MNEKVLVLQQAVADEDKEAIRAALDAFTIADSMCIPDDLIAAAYDQLEIPVKFEKPVDVKANANCIPMVDTNDDGLVDAIDTDGDGVADVDDAYPNDPTRTEEEDDDDDDDSDDDSE